MAKAAKKKATKKKATKAKTAGPAKKAAKKSPVLGCCTLVGSGPDMQIPHITRAMCIQKANELGKNPHWVPGECAE